MNSHEATPPRRQEPSPHYTKLVNTLEQKALIFGIVGELSPEGVINDYWNTLLSPLINVQQAIKQPTEPNLQESLRSTRTYSRYCADRWRFDDPSLATTFDKIILPALMSVPNAQVLENVSREYQQLGEASEPLSKAQIERIIDLALTGYGAIFGKEREERKRLETS